MIYATTKKPPGMRPQAAQQNLLLPRWQKEKQMNSRHYCTKKPPYANQLNLTEQSNLWVCTGSGAWERAKLPSWFPRSKVLLPLGDDPNNYTWTVAAGHDVVIGGFGELEPISTIALLGALLLAFGASLVIYTPERGPVTRIEARRAAA
ncbi:MAG: hypothetical protein ACXWTH_02990 [Methylosarcina sp.]